MVLPTLNAKYELFSCNTCGNFGIIRLLEVRLFLSLPRSILAKFKEKLIGEICQQSGLGVDGDFDPDASAVVKCWKTM